MASDGECRYEYDINGRLAWVNKNYSNVVSYKYDALGRLAISTTGGVSTYYYYDTAGRVIAEYSTEDDGVNLDLDRTYIWGGGFNEILTMTEGTNTKYMLTDALGSVTAVYDASTATVEFTTYDVYGNSETTPAASYGFAGMRYVGAIDGYRTPNRTYSPRLGRWLQPDPLGTMPNPQTGNVYEPIRQYSDGMNLYAYVGNEPVSTIDLLGLKRVIALLNGQNMMGLANKGTLSVALANEPWKNDRNNIVRFFEEDADWNYQNATGRIKKQAQCNGCGYAKCCHKIILVGHSNGGDGARKIAKKLDTLPVELLFLFDPVPKPWRVGNPDNAAPLQISSNVNKAISYYQRQDTRKLFGVYMQGWIISAPGTNYLWKGPFVGKEKILPPGGNEPEYPHTYMIYALKNQLASAIASVPTN